MWIQDGFLGVAVDGEEEKKMMFLNTIVLLKVQVKQGTQSSRSDSSAVNDMLKTTDLDRKTVKRSATLKKNDDIVAAASEIYFFRVIAKKQNNYRDS